MMADPFALARGTETSGVAQEFRTLADKAQAAEDAQHWLNVANDLADGLLAPANVSVSFGVGRNLSGYDDIRRRITAAIVEELPRFIETAAADVIMEYREAVFRLEFE